MIAIDTSALLAFLYREPGHEVVEPLIDGGKISAANWSETLQKIAFHGGNPDRQGMLFMTMGLMVEPLTEADAATAARFYATTRNLGLSLGDRCCFALAHRLGFPVLTADKTWTEVNLPIEVQLIR